MATIPIGLQLYSVRGECERDLAGALEAVAKLGYVGVEPWGYSGDSVKWLGWDARDMRTMLDDNGLTCCGMHIMTGALLGDSLARTIELNRTLGNRFLIVAADKERMSATATIMELAGILNAAAEKLQSEGMFTGYHAHPFDFVRVDGEIAWYTLFRNTAREVIMQMDIGNCANGDGDPVDVLRVFPGRAKTVHLKDYGFATGEGVIGEGKADWPTIFKLCEEQHPVEWYVVEEGSRGGLGFDVCGRSLAALKRMGKG